MRAFRSTRTRRPRPGTMNMPFFFTSAIAVFAKCSRNDFATLLLTSVFSARARTSCVWVILVAAIFLLFDSQRGATRPVFSIEQEFGPELWCRCPGLIDFNNTGWILGCKGKNCKKPPVFQRFFTERCVEGRFYGLPANPPPLRH